MDPLIATMDQSSIGNNKNKKITSSPATNEQNSKVIHKTDQAPISPLILSSSNMPAPVPASLEDNDCIAKNNHHVGQNHYRTSLNNHTECDSTQTNRASQKPKGNNDDYDDNDDVVVVTKGISKTVNKTPDSRITEMMTSLTTDTTIKSNNTSSTSKHDVCKESEGTFTSNQIPSSPIAPHRTSTITTPTSCPDVPKNHREASHHRSPSPLPTSTTTVPQRRLPPIIKAQSLDFGCDDDQIHSLLHDNHLFQPNHFQHYHHFLRNHHYNQHPHHIHEFPHHVPLSPVRKLKTMNKGCSLDNQRSEDEDTSRGNVVPGTSSTEDVDADVDEDDEEELATKRITTAPITPTTSSKPAASTTFLRSHTVESETVHLQQRPRSSSDYLPRTVETADNSQQTDVIRMSSPQLRQHTLTKGVLPKVQSLESRPIYPNVPYSPYASPYGSPRSNRRRTPLRESRRISIEQSGSFLQLNQYKLMDQIGQGSYGLVKLAYSEEDSTHYAMKILSKRRLLRKAGLMSRGPKKTTSPLDRVYREIAVLKKLDHPNVVKLIEVLDDPLEDSLYLVFELMKQGEVLRVPTDKPLTEERAWSVFRDAVQGLEYLHYQRIIHADIKPDNLLLTECGHVKIADLGVCNEFLGEDATMNNGSTAGTPAFRAPETLFPGQHLYSGKAADIWALGATLYSLVYGSVPFLANSVPMLYEKIKNESLTIPEKPAVSGELLDLIKKMLTKDPAKRITLPQIKEHPWVTANGVHPLPSEDENCRLVQISEEDINCVVKSIPKLDTLILIKTMLKNHSFSNPFGRGVSGRAPQRGGSRLERFTRAGRSNSAPGAYHSPIDRQLSADCILPALSEHTVVSSSNEVPEES